MLKILNEVNKEMDHFENSRDELNLETASIDQMLDFLTIEEREAFESAIKTTEGLNSLIKPWVPFWISNEYDPKLMNTVPYLSELISAPPKKMILHSILDFMY